MEGWDWQKIHTITEMLPEGPGTVEGFNRHGRDPFEMIFPLRGADGVLWYLPDARGCPFAAWTVRSPGGSASEYRYQRAAPNQGSEPRAKAGSALCSNPRTQGVVAEVDENGAYPPWVNRTTRNMFGYRRDELIGQPLELLVPEHLQALSMPGYQRQIFASPRQRGQKGPGPEPVRNRKMELVFEEAPL